MEKETAKMKAGTSTVTAIERRTLNMSTERTVDAQASAIWHPRTIIGFLRRTLSKGQKEYAQ